MLGVNSQLPTPNVVFYPALPNASTWELGVGGWELMELLPQLVENYLQDGGGRHSHDRSDDTQQVPADEERHDHGHGTHTHLTRHDLRHQDVILELLLH